MSATLISSTPVVSVIIPTFNDGANAWAAAKALLMQQLPDHAELQVIIVDDGSEESSTDIDSGLIDSRVTVLRLPENQGRSTACNQGAGIAKADLVLFMDSDCQPTTDRFIIAHLDCLRGGFIASVGHVIGTGGGFWERYQYDASLRRQRQHQRGYSYAASSTNFVVLKSAFERIGGFDTRYRKYGFEDRDLLIRLAEKGDVAWVQNATVRHLDLLTLPAVCRKMMDAGQYSSGYFSECHSKAYRQLGYAAVDVRIRPWLRPLGNLVGPRLLDITRRCDSLLQSRWLPYPLRKLIVKVLTALSFLYGTVRGSEQNPIK